MKCILKLSLSILLSVYLTALWGQSADWNLDFENWYDIEHGTNLQDSIIENHIAGYPKGWFYDPENIPEGTGIGQSTDAISGTHAVTLSGFYTYPIMRIQTGINPLHSGWPINYRPSELTGDYKSILLSSTNATCDSLRAYVSLYLTKYHENTFSRDTIGLGEVTLAEQDDYKEFIVNINYNDNTTIPDTVSIVLSKERFGHCGSSHQGCYECSHVYFDNLQLTRTTSTHDSPLLDYMVEIFPNPTSQNIFIKSECKDCLLRITLINTMGQIIKRYNSVRVETDINISDIRKGLYIVKIQDDRSDNYLLKKLIIE